MINFEETLRKTLQEIAAKNNLSNYYVEIKPLSTEGANYSSVIFSAKIVSPDKEEICMFAKVASLSPAIRTQMNADNIYYMERYVYNDLAAIYNDLQEKYKIPEEVRFKFPKFYASNATEFEETIVLEDLTAQGYRLYDRLKPVNWEYASKVVEEIAKFHALSFAFEKYRPEEFPKADSRFNMSLTSPRELLKNGFKGLSAPSFSALSEDLRSRLETFVEDQWSEEKFRKYYGPAKKSVLAHGDYRASNILFKRQGGKIKSLIPIDYQTVHLGSPCTDLLFFIYSGSDDVFRRLHLKQLLNLYHDTLSRFLTWFQLDPDTVYSKQEFEEEFRDFAAYGLITAAMILPMVMVDPKNIPDMSEKKADMSTFNVLPTEAFKDRICHIVNEFSKIGVL